jgi:hypothetical protein
LTKIDGVVYSVLMTTMNTKTVEAEVTRIRITNATRSGIEELRGLFERTRDQARLDGESGMWWTASQILIVIGMALEFGEIWAVEECVGRRATLNQMNGHNFCKTGVIRATW